MPGTVRREAGSGPLDLLDELRDRPAAARRGAVDPSVTDRRAGRAVAALVVLAAVVTVGAVFLVATWYPALRFASAAPPVPTTTAAPPPRPTPSFTPSPGAPALRVVDAMLASPPTGLPGGMSPASSISGTVSPALSLACDEPVGPVVSHQKSWAAAAAPLGSGLTVTVSAYSAGAGAAAMQAMRSARAECRKGATVNPLPAVGVEALSVSRVVANVPISSAVFRRGDVLVSVTGARVQPPAPVLSDLSARLERLLSAPGVCPDQTSDVAQFARSLVIGPARYRGLEVPTPVALPSDTPLPRLVSPSAPLDLPSPVIATTPAAPYWPAAAPAPVPSPTAPAVPTPYPTQTAIAQPQPDTIGPGCGWAFTGMRAPAFDEQSAARLTSERAAAAVRGMQEAVAAYPAQAGAYEGAWSAYAEAGARYAEVNAKIAEVEAAWAVIRGQQQAYAQALARYQQELNDWSTFAQRQADARAAYAAALAACASATATPTQPPAPTNPPGPTAIPWPTDLPWPSNLPRPTLPIPTIPPIQGAPGARSAAAAPFLAAPGDCPPTPDPIIGAAPPASPVSPTPPADPRPTPMPTGGGTR